MKSRNPFLHLVPLVGVAALLAIAMGPVPGKWKVKDGGKQVKKPPVGSSVDTALILNAGPDTIYATSKGTTTNELLVINPTGVSTPFYMPEGAKAVVLRDINTNGLSAKGTIFWAETGHEPDDIGGGGGGIE